MAHSEFSVVIEYLCSQILDFKYCFDWPVSISKQTMLLNILFEFKRGSLYFNFVKMNESVALDLKAA